MKKVIFVNHIDEVTFYFLQKSVGESNILSIEGSLLSDQELAQIAELFPNKKEDRMYNQTERKFGDILRDKSLEIVVVNTKTINPAYLDTVFKRLAYEVHALDCQTSFVCIQGDISLKKPTKNSIPKPSDEELAKLAKEDAVKPVEKKYTYFVSADNDDRVIEFCSILEKGEDLLVSFANEKVSDTTALHALNDASIKLFTFNVNNFEQEDKVYYARNANAAETQIIKILISSDLLGKDIETSETENSTNDLSSKAKDGDSDLPNDNVDNNASSKGIAPSAHKTKKFLKWLRKFWSKFVQKDITTKEAEQNVKQKKVSFAASIDLKRRRKLKTSDLFMPEEA